MPYNTMLFDLDGTLLDTLGDLTDAVNAALGALGRPHRTEDEVRSFVGNGVGLLARRALGGEGGVERFLSVFTDHYDRNMMARTRPYPGVIELLTALKATGVRVAVVSNKYDSAVKALCAHYFGDLVQSAVGEGNGVAKKPAPDGALKALKALGAEREGALYIGDSDVDVQTAHNAHLRCAAVTWGFRDREALAAAGAEYLIDEPAQLMALTPKGM